MKRSAHIIISSYDDLKNPYYAGGGATVVRHIADQLSKTYTVTILTGNYPGAKNITRGSLRIKRIGPSQFGPKFSQLVFFCLLPWYAKRLSYDLWIESFNPPFSTAFLPFFSKRPIVGFVQMLSGEDMQRKYKLPFPTIERFGLKKYKHFIVMSEVFKKKISVINPQAQCYVIPNGVETIDRGKNSKGRHILYLGRLEYNQKGIDLLLDAYASIADKTSLDLLIAGSGSASDLTLINQKIDQLHIQPRVRLVGKVSGIRKQGLLRNAACVVVPSRFDTFPTVALEAMSYSKPLVGFNIDGFNWVPKECMIKVKPFNYRVLGKYIHKLAHDQKLRVSMGSQGKKISKQYLWTHVSKQYEHTISEVLHNTTV